MASAFSQPKLARLVTLLGELRDGTIRVPRFQRPPLWAPDQRLLLLESLYSGFPIGAILTWNTSRVMPEFQSVGPLRPAQGAPAGGRIYLLDGHQRLATLFGALGLGIYDVKDRAKAWDQRFAVDEWKVWFDVEAGNDGAHFVQRRTRERDVPPSWVPLDAILDPYAVSEQVDRLRKALFDRTIVNRVTWLSDRLREYTVPIIELQTDDLDVVTTTFQRLNSAGTAMSETHMVKALCWQDNFDLEDEIDRLAASISVPLWRPFARERILDVAKALLGLPVTGVAPDALARGIRARPPGGVGRLSVLREAAELLENMTNVLDWLQGPAALPYAYQAMLIALATKDLRADLNKDRVFTWFVSTTFTEAFAGASSSRFKRARDHLASYLSGRTDDPLPEPDVLASELGRHDFNAALGKGQAILLAHAWYFRSSQDSGASGDPAAGFEHLAMFGAEAFARPPRGDDAPDQATVAARFLTVEGMPWTPVGVGWIMRRPRAHLVTPEAEAALLKGDLRAFLRLRLAEINAYYQQLTDGLPRPTGRNGV